MRLRSSLLLRYQINGRSTRVWNSEAPAMLVSVSSYISNSTVLSCCCVFEWYKAGRFSQCSACQYFTQS